MTFYISTQSIASSLRQSVLRMQSDLAASGKEIATGHYADTGLALGYETGALLSLQGRYSSLQTIMETNETAGVRLAATEKTLSSLQASAQDLLDALIQANGSTVNAQTIQATGQSDLKTLIASLNTALNGDYIFAGTNTASQPITDYYAPAAPNKAAVDSAFLATFGFGQTSPSVSSVSAASIQDFLDTQFAPLFQGSNWASNWSSASGETLTSQISASQTVNTSVSANAVAFRQLAQAYTMIADLGIQHLNSDAYGTVVTTARGLLSSAISNLIDLQANVGLIQSNIASSTNQMSVQTDILSAQIGNLENINTYEVATHITELQTQLETSYSLTSRLQRLSLVEYL